MNHPELEIKVSFITGLDEIVSNEISRHNNLVIKRVAEDSFYLDFIEDLNVIKSLRSIARAYLVIQSPQYNPLHISSHKSIVGGLTEKILNNRGDDDFKSFKISCAGSDSEEVRAIAQYVEKTYGLIEAEEADIKIHIVRLDRVWEVGIQITSRPLSMRAYKVRNMPGAMDPTIAYAVNSLSEIETKDTYLNVCSGSGTLLIEAMQEYPHLKKCIGFDKDKKHISLAIQNIKEAGLIQKIQLYEKDLLQKPDFGLFDVVTSDLPFGMVISKDENLENLYRGFVEYTQEKLESNGRLAVYTSEYEIFEKCIRESKFEVIKTLSLKFTTSVNTYLYPKIFVCRLK